MLFPDCLPAQSSNPLLPTESVDPQPLTANIQRVVNALEFLGAPMPRELHQKILAATKSTDSNAIQDAIDSHVLFLVQINPESRVKLPRGPAPARLQQLA